MARGLLHQVGTNRMFPLPQSTPLDSALLLCSLCAALQQGRSIGDGPTCTEGFGPAGHLEQGPPELPSMKVESRVKRMAEASSWSYSVFLGLSHVQVIKLLFEKKNTPSHLPSEKRH